jgi:N-hydroxyarylamine O-acetyltransferase
MGEQGYAGFGPPMRAPLRYLTPVGAAEWLSAGGKAKFAAIRRRIRRPQLGRPVDLDSYFRRIGYEGPRSANLETLRQLHRLHPAAIPFETIDVVRGAGVDLTPEAVESKLVGQHRGGYCFEQNMLFKRALTALGFEVEGLICRSRWGRAPGDDPPRAHMALRVRLDGEDWFADVGFGGCMLTAPIRMAERGTQETCFEPVRLRAAGEELRLEALIKAEWLAVCDVVPQPQLDTDFIAPNWWASTHPDSPFRKTLMVSRPGAEARYALRENRLTIRRPGAETERRALGLSELEACLATDFGLPVTDDWRPRLEHAVELGSAQAVKA